MTLKIAMTAHSLIYAPVYRAAAKLNEDNALTVGFDWASSDPGKRLGHGDEGALNQLLAGKVDLCVCDPQVLVSKLLFERSMKRPYSEARILAVLVARPALWMLRTPNCVAKLRKALHPGGTGVKESVAKQIEDNFLSRRKVPLGRICTYDKRSSSQAILAFMKREGYFSFEEDEIREVARLGEELEYMGAAPPDPVDVVVTCDCIAAQLFSKGRLGSEDANIFAWHRSRAVKAMPFTAIIGRDLGGQPNEVERKHALKQFLREVESSLRIDIREGRGIEKVVESVLDCGFPPLPSNYVSTIGKDKLRSHLVTQGVQILNRFNRSQDHSDVGSFFPETIRPDRRWVRKGLLYSASEIWREPSREWIKRLKESWATRRVIRKSIDRTAAVLACPKGPLEHVRSFIDARLSYTTAERRRQVDIFCALMVSVVLLVLEFFCPAGSPMERLGAVAGSLNKSHVILGLLLLVSVLRRDRKT